MNKINCKNAAQLLEGCIIMLLKMLTEIDPVTWQNIGKRKI